MYPGALSLHLQGAAGFKKGASGAQALGLDRRRESLHSVASHDGHFGCKYSLALVVLWFCAQNHAQREALNGDERLNPILVDSLTGLNFQAQASVLTPCSFSYPVDAYQIREDCFFLVSN